MKKYIKHIALFACALLLIFIALEKACQYYIPKRIIEKAYWLKEKQHTNYDYLVLGSSRAESSFDCNYFDSITKMKGVNIAINGSGLLENELTLIDFLKTNKTKTLYLEIDEFNLSPSNHFSYPFHYYLYFPYMYDDVLVDSLIKSKVPKEKYYIWKYIPFVKYAAFNAKFKLEKIINKENVDSVFDKKGYQPFYGQETSYTFIDWKGDFIDKRYWYLGDYSKPSPEYEKTDSLSIQSIKNIISICNKHDIKLVFFIAPSFVGHFEKQLYNSLDKFVLIKKIAQDNKIPLINFAYWKYNRDYKIYHDYTHINTEGAKKMTAIMSMYQSNNFVFNPAINSFFQDSICSEFEKH
jgi:hypothetical protein